MKFKENILEILCKDYNTNMNLIFATNEYENKKFSDEISIDFAKNFKSGHEKSEEAKIARKKYAAEVMTPTSIIKKMNLQLIKNFNDEEIVNKTVCESCCGECPFISNKHDVTNGKEFDFNERYGMLDIKMKSIKKLGNITDEKLINLLDTLGGYEFQGDNLYIGRKNILEDFIDWYEYLMNKEISEELMIKSAEIISKNFEQLDGLTFEQPKEKLK